MEICLNPKNLKWAQLLIPKFNYLWSFWNVNMAWNGFSKMAVAIFSHYFGPNPLKGTLNGSFLYPWTTKIPVAWNLYPLFTTPIFSLKYILYWKKTTSKMFQAIAFFSYLFEPKYFTGAISRLWTFVSTQKNSNVHNF